LLYFNYLFLIVNRRIPESAIFGGAVIQLEDWNTPDEILSSELEIIEKYKPVYIYCVVESTKLSEINVLEKHGYHFVEFRIYCQLNLSEINISTKSFYPFTAALIGHNSDIKAAESLLLEGYSDDRYSNDPGIGKSLAKKRIVENLYKSYRAHPKEFVLGVFNSQSEKLVAFRSGELIGKNEAIYYQYGVDKTMPYEAMVGMLESFTIEYLKGRHVQIIHSVSTGFNIHELNRLISDNNFKIVKTKVLVRKLVNPDLWA